MTILETAKNLVKQSDLDAWLLLTAEDRDPHFRKLISPNLSLPTIALILPAEDTILLTHPLDVDLLKDIPGTTLDTYNYDIKLEDKLTNILLSRPALKRIGVNFSTMNDPGVDVLGHGFFLFLEDTIKNIPDSTSRKFVSAEGLIYGLLDTKTEKDIERMRIAARRALELINEAFKNIKKGMTELDLVRTMHELMSIRPGYFNEHGVVAEECSWEPENCPIVLTGSSFEKGGHALSTEVEIVAGSTVYFDFGVKLTFDDGSSWSSDIQRTAYILKNGEQSPPPEIKRRFTTIIDAISAGIEQIRPGLKGHEADNIVRSHIVKAGYPDYDHGTGHAIGELAHNPGTALSKPSSRMANLDIQANGVYTIEPRIPLSDGVSIEEMVWVQPEGRGVALCDRQVEPICIQLRS